MSARIVRGDDAFRHAVLEDHRTGELGHLLEVVRGAVRDPAEHDLLGGTPCKGDLHPVDELLAGVEEALLLGKVERVAEGIPTRNDRRLVHGEPVTHQERHQRVAALVVGQDPLLLLRHHLPLLEAGDDPLQGAVEVGLVDVLLPLAAREDGRLVCDVRQVGSRQTRRLAGDRGQVDVRGERLAPGVDVEDRFAAGEVRRRDEDLPVEPPRAQKRRVEVLEPIRRAHDDDLVAVGEPVELDEQLVQGLVLLTVEAMARARRADRVELVDEDDRGLVLAGLLEELPDPSGAEAGEHLDERGGALRVEVRAGSVRDGLRKQGLPRSGRTVEQDALGHAGAERAKRFESRRKSTISSISARASSRPATLSQLIDERALAWTCVVFTRGITWSVRQSR